jgi:AraC-like DNA-binding protein
MHLEYTRNTLNLKRSKPLNMPDRICNDGDSAPGRHGGTLPAVERATIAISFVDAALQGVRARGLDTGPLLEAVGIAPNLLLTPQARVPAARYAALWRLIARTLDDEFFGRDSRRMKSGSFALLCRGAVHCRTLRPALERMLRYFDVFLDDLTLTLSEHGRHARLTIIEKRRDGRNPTFAHEALLVMLHGTACWLVNRRIPILQAGFSYPEPAHSAEYRTMFSTRLSYEQPTTAIEFDASYLDLRVVQSESTAKEFLRLAPENIIVKYKNARSLTARIRRRLRQLAPADWPDEAALADELHTSAASVRRKLNAEGQSYQRIKDDLRRDMAITYLSAARRSVMDIAHELGFAEPSAFHRAFKRWTGSSPAAYRKTGHSRAGASAEPTVK